MLGGLMPEITKPPNVCAIGCDRMRQASIESVLDTAVRPSLGLLTTPRPKGAGILRITSKGFCFIATAIKANAYPVLRSLHRLTPLDQRPKCYLQRSHPGHARFHIQGKSIPGYSTATFQQRDHNAHIV